VETSASERVVRVSVDGAAAERDSKNEVATLSNAYNFTYFAQPCEPKLLLKLR